MNGITIRALDTADMPQYRELRLRALSEHPEAFAESATQFKTKTLEQVVSRFNSSQQAGGFMAGAFRPDGTLVGTVGFARLEGEKLNHRGLLWGMYVVPEVRRNGTGKRLVEELLKRANTIQGLTQIHLSVITTNTAAKKLYDSLGFECYGTEPAALMVGGNSYDEFLMVKKLHV